LVLVVQGEGPLSRIRALDDGQAEQIPLQLFHHRAGQGVAQVTLTFWDVLVIVAIIAYYTKTASRREGK
jgi:hypothetical protein